MASSSTATPGGSVALVYGASGVTGHAILKALLANQTPSFARIIGLTNRPLSGAVARLPDDQRLELYSGCDLLDRDKSLLQLQHIPGIQGVTHMYYAAYGGHGSEFKELRRVNEEMLTNAVGGMEVCCPGLRFVTLNTGGKAYGVEFRDHVTYEPPLKESAPRIPEPYASNIFYYGQYDIMQRASIGKGWTFCEIRPDVIVGFVPQNNAMNMAQGLALYFSLYKELHGAGAEVSFPYGQDAWEALHTDSSADILARFHVFASMRPELVSERAFNVADGPAFAWSALWPRLAEFFDLRGTGPTGQERSLGKWVHDHQHEWDGFVAKRGLKDGALAATNFEFVDAVMGIPFRRDYDLSSSREVGFTEERSPVEGYKIAFEEMRIARIIP